MAIEAYGDENRSFHTLAIHFDAATHTASGYVDGQLIGTDTRAAFAGPMTVRIGVDTWGKRNVDVRFDNFVLDYPTALGASSQ